MTLKKSSPNTFGSMFRYSAKKVCFVPIITFLYFIYSTIESFYYSGGKYNLIGLTQLEETDVERRHFGYFWDCLTNVSSDVFGIMLGVISVLSAIIIFSFAFSKKQCNVIFSLGMSRRKIFLSSYLAGLLPFYFAVIFAAFLELLTVYCLGYAMVRPLVEIAVYYVLSVIGCYTLPYTITAVFFALSGNLIEATVFTAIGGFLPQLLLYYISNMMNLFTFGTAAGYNGKWNFFNTYFYFTDFTEKGDFVSPYINEYFFFNSDGSPFYKLTIFDFSGIIMDFVYTAIFFAVGYFLFAKRKNEIAGAFGRAKGLTELCAVVVGLVVSITAIYIFGLSDHGNGNFVTYLLMLVFFAVGYIAFKMIFGSKRKAMLKKLKKTLPAYAAVIAIVTVILSTGALGYSSKLPKADEIESIKFETELCRPTSFCDTYYLTTDVVTYGYLRTYTGSTSGYLDPHHCLYGGADTVASYNTIHYTVTDNEEIEKLVKVHEKLINDGKIKNNASNACNMTFIITYTLKNGKTISRYYSEASEGAAKQILTLTDSEFSKNQMLSVFEDYYSGDSSVSEEAVYLYSKDLTSCHYIGLLNLELKEAIYKDLGNQTSDEIFYHKAEDELGVLTLGTNTSYVEKYFSEDTYIYYEELDDYAPAPVNFEVGDELKTEVVATYGQPHSIVITKDMVNTIEYLTKNNFIGYFDTKVTANDVKSVKLGAKSQIRDVANSEVLPLFVAAHSTAEANELLDTDTDVTHLFEENVNNEITNKSTIQKILDNSFLYGFCGNNYRIAEVTYNDGSISTFCITDEVYNSLMK